MFMQAVGGFKPEICTTRSREIHLLHHFIKFPKINILKLSILQISRIKYTHEYLKHHSSISSNKEKKN